MVGFLDTILLMNHCKSCWNRWFAADVGLEAVGRPTMVTSRTSAACCMRWRCNTWDLIAIWTTWSHLQKSFGMLDHNTGGETLDGRRFLVSEVCLSRSNATSASWRAPGKEIMQQDIFRLHIAYYSMHTQILVYCICTERIRKITYIYI